MDETIPQVVRENSADQCTEDVSRKEALFDSTEMPPVKGIVEVAVPASVFWEAFSHSSFWPRWNKCFFWVHNRELKLGDRLVWAFEPIRPWYLYKMFAVAKIVELEPERKVTWEVTALPGFYARHTYHAEDLGGGRTRFGSWEKAEGAQIRFPLTRKFWVAHFTFVKDRSLEGARHLEDIYLSKGRINGDLLKPRRHWLFWACVILLLLVLAASAAGTWFYLSYLRLSEVELAPGVYAVLAGGGNSLVVKDGGDVLLVDTKFPPASDWLQKWLAHNVGSPVTVVVNTHYHYDHTQGNTDYPAAKIYAQRAAPELMKRYDGDWWDKHPNGLPAYLVDDTATLRVGGQDVVLNYPGPGHTKGDLWVYLRRGDKEIVSTGDIFLNGYYPFMDLDEGGVDLQGMVNTLRMLASRYPEATFLPGHGPVARAGDLLRFADYLEFLQASVAQARQRGLTEDQAAEQIDLSHWLLSRLPSYHHGKLCWATAESNIRWVFQLQTHRVPSDHCTF